MRWCRGIFPPSLAVCPSHRSLNYYYSDKWQKEARTSTEKRHWHYFSASNRSKNCCFAPFGCSWSYGNKHSCQLSWESCDLSPHIDLFINLLKGFNLHRKFGVFFLRHGTIILKGLTFLFFQLQNLLLHELFTLLKVMYTFSQFMYVFLEMAVFVFHDL